MIMKNIQMAVTLMSVFGFAISGSSSSNAGTIKKKILPNNGTGQVDRSKIRGISQLSKSDCKLLLNGEVVYVTDGRCGASGAYCKSSTVSACITQ